MRKIGIDKRDPTYRHFYFDDSEVLTSNPPKYKIWFVDDENDVDYIECSKVLKIKDAPVETQTANEDVIKIDNIQDEKADIAIPAHQKDEVDKLSDKEAKEQPEPKKRGRKKKPVEDTTIKVENNEPTQATISQLVVEQSNLKFEYKAFNVDFSSVDELVDLLNEYGEDGWELCTSEIYSGGMIFDKKKIFCIMKRIKGLEN
jgi:hypothetical protein